MFRSILLKALYPIHSRLRAERSRLAIRIMQPEASMSLLDIGGEAGFGREYDDLRSLFRRVVVVNPDAQKRRELSSKVEFEVADGCALPYPDQSFDWVFSNAVIEHVGNRQRQEMFAREIHRVAREGYFLATPNKHFFLDPHSYFPFYHLLPESVQKIAVHFSFGQMLKWEPLRLLSAKELWQMFPEAEAVKTVGFLGTNLVVYSRKQTTPSPKQSAIKECMDPTPLSR